MALIGLLCCSICQPVWASDEAWVKRAEEFQTKTWWTELPLPLAIESYFLGAFKTGGPFGDRIIDSDALSYSAVGLFAVSFILPLGIPEETRKEGREIRKHDEKGFWKTYKENSRRMRLLRNRVTAPRDLEGVYFIQPFSLGVGVSRPAKLVDVTIEKMKAINVTPDSPLDKNIQQWESSIGVRYGLTRNILIGVDAGASDGSISYLNIINPNGSRLGELRYRLRALFIDAIAEWRVPMDFQKLNFFIGAGPTYYHTAFTEAISWKGNTTWQGSTFGGKAGIRAEWYMLKHTSVSFNIAERFGRIRQVKTGAGDVLRNNAGENVPIDLTATSFTAGINYRF